MNAEQYSFKIEKRPVSFRVALSFIALIFFSACNQLEKPKTEPFYSQTAPPAKQEFRWSNGKMPKSFDPAQASAPPETDIVRAVFEGLTDMDAKTLKTVPAVAKDWKSSEDDRVWTFNLRRDARWSNGETVKAQDFVRSWKRLAELEKKAAHSGLLENIVGVKTLDIETGSKTELSKLDILGKNTVAENLRIFPIQPNNNSSGTGSNSDLRQSETEKNSNTQDKNDSKAKTEIKFGAEAIDNFTLQVSLIRPDKDFPALVAHPIFRPIYDDGKQFESGKLNADIVTNGAFRIFSVGQDGITLDRADYYWNKKSVEIERVRLIPTENAEKALEAYRAGEIDAVTNADFEPLALKLLTPFDDFRLTTHSALNYYEFNLTRQPFDNRLVREALTIAIERERLTESDMDGASFPALNFLPYDQENETKFVQDVGRARDLLSEAGFPDGENFPTIKLLVNRNNIQQRIARSVAKMWKQNLNIDTEITVKDSAELETAAQSGDFDIVRRNAVLATTDEAANMATIFIERGAKSSVETPQEVIAATAQTDIETKKSDEQAANSATASKSPEPAETLSNSKLTSEKELPNNSALNADNAAILTEKEAFNQIRAIPLYFPTSFSLVKSYVQGFEINSLDAPSLKDVKIKIDQTKTANGN